MTPDNGHKPTSGSDAPALSAQMVEKLMVMLKQFAGFRTSPQIQRKLERIFRHPTDLAEFIRAAEADASKAELATLVEDLTNHETYFFRERAHLDALEHIVLPALIAQKKRQAGIKKISLWSAACATGEEAYTLAMLTLNTLLKLGIGIEPSPGNIVLPSDWKLEVLGTDISRQAIRIARDATYTQRQEGLSSFRQFPSEYLRFFEHLSDNKALDRQTWRIKDSVRQHVRFDLYNLMNSPPPQLSIDVIFCRNVLIYMDMESQKTIMRSLYQALQRGGCLMLSLVDSMTVPNLFHENRQRRCVIYEKP
ncbi:MAG: protein-glutamate O-methyltransferase CheR [Pseudomonadales bacterium]|nr:protein-glutamate O-methyltransferase CheR [Pseudomonadales bacterium]